VISFASASQTLSSQNYKNITKKIKQHAQLLRPCCFASLSRAEPSRETFYRSKQRQGIFEDCQHFSFSFSLRVRPVNPISLCFTFVFGIIWRCARSQNQKTTPVLSPVDYYHKRDGKNWLKLVRLYSRLLIIYQSLLYSQETFLRLDFTDYRRAFAT